MFELDITRWVEEAKDRIGNAPLTIGYALLGRLEEHTPVVTGTLRAGWQIEVEPDRVLIVNNVEYARRVNDGFVGLDALGRYYDQAGRHFVEQTIAEAPDVIAEALRQ
jgi:Bacteriophage HK97-gp10, putative tail-component